MGARSGPALAMFTSAQRATSLARRTGMDVEEAADTIRGGLTRRHLLAGAGAAALGASLSTVWSEPASAAAHSRARVLVVGSGIAGLGCAFRLWRTHGIRADVYEWADRPGGRIRTLRDHFDDGQLVEEHGEFINPEHTVTLALAKRFGLRLDNADRYPPGPNPDQETFRFNGHRFSQARLNRDWHRFGYRLFHDAAIRKAPFPTRFDRSTHWGRRWDHMSVAEWLDAEAPGGSGGDFGQLCISAVLDEYGGAPEEQSALNLIYLLGEDASTKSGNQPRSAPVLGGADEKWHLRGGNDQLISGILRRLPAGALHVGERLVALADRGHGRVTATFTSGHHTHDVVADHVVLALPFTTLRDVDTSRVSISRLHRRAIREEPLGSNAKLFLQYSHRVWDEKRKTANSYTDGVVQGSWDATGYQPGTAGVLAALPGGTIGKEWGSRYGLHHHRGNPPRRMVDDYLAGFEALFPGSRSAYNGKGFYVWSSGDPHIRGAYSYLKVGQYTGFNGIQGRREGPLHFAGEHTSINYQGYIEGALRSGRRCADEIGGKKPS
jgi:monoamine oxidase